MQARVKPRHSFDNLLEEAGLGSIIWSRPSFWAACSYPFIIALCTALVLLFTLPALVSLPLTLVCIALYLLYFVVRIRLDPAHKARFYEPRVQFLRAEISIVAITFIIGLLPGVNATPLWLLYVLIFLLVSKHCTTAVLISIVAQTWIFLVVIQLLQQPMGDSIFKWVGPIVETLDRLVFLGLFAFILHYLVRNIDARRETIAAYSAVGAAIRSTDLGDMNWARHWQPLLSTLLTYLDGECASTWVYDPKTRMLTREANVQRGKLEQGGMNLLDESQAKSISSNDDCLIARVVRSGEPNHAIMSATEVALSCAAENSGPPIYAELAVPITLGQGERRTTLGVLSVGFRVDSFHARLLPEYQNFVQGLVNQAKPMLMYAQRLDELSALQDVSRRVFHSLDLNTILDNFLCALADTLGFEFGTISLVDEERRVIRSVRGVNVPQQWLEMAIHALDSSDIQADIVRTGKTEVLFGPDPRFDQRIWKKFGHTDMIRVFMPIEVADPSSGALRIIGTVEAGYRRSTRTEIAPDQLRMLAALKTLLGMAIEHARLLQSTQDKADLLAALERTGQVVLSTKPLPRVLDEIAQQAAAFLDAGFVMLYRYNRERKTVDPPVIYGELNPTARLNLRLDHETLLTRLLSESQPYYSPDVLLDPELGGTRRADTKNKYTFVKRQNIKSFTGIPLRAGDETVGVLFVNYRRRHRFAAEERQIIELFAQQAALAIKNAESHELARELIVREERNHLSRELHHSVSQALFGIALQAQNALDRLTPDSQTLRQEFTNILEIAHVASTETLFIFDELRAPVDEGNYLQTGLEEYIRRIKKWYNLEVVTNWQLDEPIAPSVEQVLARIGREALNNAVRHARCRTVWVTGEANAEHVCLSVRDDGIGFDTTRVPPRKLGLASMRELADSIQGTLHLASAPGAGTQVMLEIWACEEG
ncbi:MAG: GAF domain-containing protein [Chloroflexi bacterium]|nr:GAF domain-containing protein [Chloroflexota bacterium]